MSTPTQPSSATTTLILLRISMALVVTLAVSLLLIYRLHDQPYGTALIYAAALAGCFYVGREFLALLRSLEGNPSSRPRHTPQEDWQKPSSAAR